MKLRNKKTGEIKEVTVGGYPVSGNTKIWECSEMDANEETGYKTLGTYSSLSELNAEWEDYEEPKKYWFINPCGEVISFYEEDENPADTKASKAIGDYFDTREEAEKAVEKLKAWKRLKDKGLTFCAWKITDDGCSVDVETTLDAEIVRAEQKYITDDLNLLFGGEE